MVFIVQQEELGKREKDWTKLIRDSWFEERLSATDNAMMQEGQDTKEQIGFWQDEIRKLWAVSNERNKNGSRITREAIIKLLQVLMGLLCRQEV